MSSLKFQLNSEVITQKKWNDCQFSYFFKYAYRCRIQITVTNYKILISIFKRNSLCDNHTTVPQQIQIGQVNAKISRFRTLLITSFLTNLPCQVFSPKLVLRCLLKLFEWFVGSKWNSWTRWGNPSLLSNPLWTL